MSGYNLITFKNTHDAINGEKFLKEKGFSVVVMPTPTSITKSCGISLRIDMESFIEIKQLINNNLFEIEKAYLKSETGYTLIE